MTDQQLIDFVDNELNKNKEYLNACVYLDDVFVGALNLRVTFKNNHREAYSKLLELCARLGGVIISTRPATYETIVRVEDGAEPRRSEDISLNEWAKAHGIDPATARQRAGRGAFETARKIGRNWVISADEELIDHRRKKEEGQ